MVREKRIATLGFVGKRQSRDFRKNNKSPHPSPVYSDNGGKYLFYDQNCKVESE